MRASTAATSAAGGEYSLGDEKTAALCVANDEPCDEDDDLEDDFDGEPSRGAVSAVDDDDDDDDGDEEEEDGEEEGGTQRVDASTRRSRADVPVVRRV
jgi:hypothetical protein